MAKKAHNTTQAGASAEAAPGGDSIQGYFRRILTENPHLLDGRSNDELLRRWREDHPGDGEPSRSVKTGLSNIKSVMRRQGRDSKGSRRAEEPSPVAEPQVARSRPAGRILEQLEEQIDECLLMAKNQDAEGLGSIIQLLRRARNEVVWKMGE